MTVELGVGRFFGAMRGQHRFAGAVITELSHPGGQALPTHRHEAPYFCLLPRGGYVEEVEGRQLEYGPFSVGFHPPLTHRDVIGSSATIFFFIEMRLDWLSGVADLLPTDPDLEPRKLDGDLACLATRLYRLHAEEMLSPETVDSALWELVGCLDRRRRLVERGQPRWLEPCLELLRAEFARPLTVLEVATTLRVHPVYLSRGFRKRFGQTLGEYLHKLRIQAACAELRDRERPLADVALAAGFSDQSHFSRVFKSQLGCSPGHFRRLLACG